MPRTIKIQIASGIIILVAIILGLSIWETGEDMDTSPDFVKIGKKPEQKICTQEAILCPDGTYVGRIGPNCEFASCPETHK